MIVPTINFEFIYRTDTRGHKFKAYLKSDAEIEQALTIEKWCSEEFGIDDWRASCVIFEDEFFSYAKAAFFIFLVKDDDCAKFRLVFSTKTTDAGL